jgi:hypothetical protein
MDNTKVLLHIILKHKDAASFTKQAILSFVLSALISRAISLHTIYTTHLFTHDEINSAFLL